MARSTKSTPEQPDEPQSDTARASEPETTSQVPADGTETAEAPLDDDVVLIEADETVEVVVVDHEALAQDGLDDDDLDDDDLPYELSGADADEAYLTERQAQPFLLGADPAGTGLGARLGAEAFGTFALVLVILGIALYYPLWSGGNPGLGPLGIALASGLALAGVTAGLGHVSGGHFNPAVSAAAAVAGRLAWVDLLLYWLAQVLGAVTAAAVIFLTIPRGLPALTGADELGVPNTARDFMTATVNGWGEASPLSLLAQGQVTFDWTAALILETVAAAILAAVVLGAAHRRSPLALPAVRRVGDAPATGTPGGGAAVAVGLTYAALLLLLTPVTGGSLNPARSSAAALFADGAALGQLWLFWVAPVVGAAIAGLVYRAVATPPADDALLDDEDYEDEEILAGRP